MRVSKFVRARKKEKIKDRTYINRSVEKKTRSKTRSKNNEGKKKTNTRRHFEVSSSDVFEVSVRYMVYLLFYFVEKPDCFLKKPTVVLKNPDFFQLLDIRFLKTKPYLSFHPCVVSDPKYYKKKVK